VPSSAQTNTSSSALQAACARQVGATQRSLAANPEWHCPQRRHPGVARRRDRSHPHGRPAGLIRKPHKEGRAKTARPAFAWHRSRPSLQSFHHPDGPTPKTPERCSRVLALPISNGASSIASALSIRLGATPRGPIHPTMPSCALSSKGDLLTWQKRGHFYLALTVLLSDFRPFDSRLAENACC
jgi:hypothetical protein